MTSIRFLIRLAAVLAIVCAAVPMNLSATEINKLSFEQKGEGKVPEEMLLFNVQTRAGANFDEKILNDDIKRLYATGFFTDVVSSTSPSADGKVDIVIKVSSKPRISSITYEGNRKFKAEKLAEKVTLTTDLPLSDEKLKTSAANLRRFYFDEGYTDAQVNPSVEDAGDGSVRVIFKIDERLRYKINDVTFVNNTVYSGWTLRHSIANQHSYLSWALDIGLLNREELERDKIRLRELYWEKGYLDFKVTDTSVTADPGDPEYVNITFTLDEGKPYTVKKIGVAGNQNVSSEELTALLSLKAGATFDSRLERKDLDAITARFYALGYCDVACKAVRLPDYETHEVDIEYTITEGLAYTVRDVRIAGNVITKDKVIRRELAIAPGDPVDKNRIEASKSRLLGMGYFEKVEAVSVASGEPEKKDIDFTVKEKETWKLNLGGAYSDTDSLGGMIELSQPNFDLTDPSNYFTGGGQRLRALAYLGLKRYNFELGFTEPWLFDYPLRLDVNAYVRNISYDKWDEQRIGGNIGLTKKIFDDFTSLSLNQTFEHVRVHNMDKDLSQMFQDEEGSDWVSTMGLNLNRDTRDSLMDPTSGYELNALGALTSQIFGASHNYYRLEMKGSYYYSFLEKALVLHLGAKAGSIHKIGSNGGGSDGRVPIYERYFLGGGDTIRGFPYRGVSPVDDNNDCYGGQSMLLLTAEMTHPIYEFIRGAIFVDGMGAWDNSNFGSFGKMNMGAGYGLRIKVPYVNAPVKLDLAYPIVNNQDGCANRLRFHFNMGFTW